MYVLILNCPCLCSIFPQGPVFEKSGLHVERWR